LLAILCVVFKMEKIKLPQIIFPKW
jgi:hypothetical protein